MALAIFYVPFPDRESAEKTVRNLIEKKLIACANITGSESFFIWQEEIKQSEEYIAIMKTTQDKTVFVRTEILSMHPYETPAVIDWKADGNDAFESWVRSSVFSSGH